MRHLDFHNLVNTNIRKVNSHFLDWTGPGRIWPEQISEVTDPAPEHSMPDRAFTTFSSYKPELNKLLFLNVAKYTLSHGPYGYRQ